MDAQQISDIQAEIAAMEYWRTHPGFDVGFGSVVGGFPSYQERIENRDHEVES
jgi:hypothetical protein